MGRTKLKKGDTVEVITGKDKGKQGEIAHVFPKTDKVLINGVNTASHAGASTFRLLKYWKVQELKKQRR